MTTAIAIKKPRLLDLAFARRAIIERIIEQGGEITDADDAELRATDASIEDKAAGYLAVMRHLEAEQAKANDEANAATGYARSCGRAVECLRERLTGCMVLAGVSKIKAANHTISTQAGKASVVIDDENVVPLGLYATMTTVTKVVTHKDVIKSAVETAITETREAGVAAGFTDEQIEEACQKAAANTVPGARVVTGKTGIRITAPRAAKAVQIEKIPDNLNATSSNNQGETENG